MLGKVDDRYGLLSIAFAGPFHCDLAARIARTAKTISQPRFPIFLPYFVLRFPVVAPFECAKLPDVREPPVSEVARANIGDSTG
jgi:hypothetical protein